jgi:hypothetical protein
MSSKLIHLVFPHCFSSLNSVFRFFVFIVLDLPPLKRFSLASLSINGDEEARRSKAIYTLALPSTTDFPSSEQLAAISSYSAPVAATTTPTSIKQEKNSIISPLPRIFPSPAKLCAAQSNQYKFPSLTKVGRETVITITKENDKKTQKNKATAVVVDASDDEEMEIEKQRETEAGKCKDDDYVYDVYTLDNTKAPTGLEGTDYIRIESFDVPDLEHEYDNGTDSEFDSDDSNAENNSRNSYPDEEDSFLSNDDSSSDSDKDRYPFFSPTDSDSEDDSDSEFGVRKLKTHTEYAFVEQDNATDDED